MSEKYILTIDQSTSATKALIFNNRGNLIDKKALEHKQYYPQPGWVEHDAEEIYQNTVKTIKLLLENNKSIKNELSVFSITNQRETVVVWDKNTGKPVHNAVVWQCQRGRELCDKLKQDGNEDLIKEKTGLLLDPYFSASKISWILENINGAREKAEKGRLLAGTIDTWLIWKLTKGEVHATDYSNASRTLLYNIKEYKWDQELLDLFKIPAEMLPEVKSSNKIFGYTDIEGIFKKNIPISGILGDSQASLFGQNCFEKGTAKTTYGTGSSIMMNIGDQFKISDKGLVTSLAWGIDDKIPYLFEGNVHVSAAAIKWMEEKLNLIDNPQISEQMARELEDNEGVYFVPAFVGLGAPYWENEAKAIITGMTFNTDQKHITRAALEAIAYQNKDVLDLMIKEAGIELKELRVDGGASDNKFLLQFQADMLEVPVVNTEVKDISALGSAFMAGLGIGFWDSLDEIKPLRAVGDKYLSQINAETRKKYYRGWKDAVKRAILKEDDRGET